MHLHIPKHTLCVLGCVRAYIISIPLHDCTYLHCIIISCGCIHPKLNVFFLTMGHFHWPFIKNSNTYNTHPNRSFYYQYNIVNVFVFSSLVYHTRAHFWAKDMGQTLVHIFMRILDACAFILNFV